MEVAVRNLGTGIVIARLNAGITQLELAVRIGVSRPTLSNWENAKTYPTVAEMRRLVAALNAPDLWNLAQQEEAPRDSPDGGEQGLPCTPAPPDEARAFAAA